MKDQIELFLSNTYWYIYLVGKGIGLTLTFMMPILFGVFGENAYEDIFLENEDIFNWEVWFSHWPIAAIVLIWVIGYLILRFFNHKDKKSQELHNALKWLYESLDIDQDVNKDIRCTIWIPVKGVFQAYPIWLLQAVDYFPIHSQLSDRRNYRKNGRRFRMFKVARKENNTLRPVGILGRATIDSVTKSESNIYHESFTSQKPFIEHMVSNWNFTNFQAERLTKDRKSYLCFAMTDHTKSELLGIIYFDSRQTRAFDIYSSNIVPLTEAMLPLFANIITSH